MVINPLIEYTAYILLGLIYIPLVVTAWVVCISICNDLKNDTFHLLRSKNNDGRTDI